ncbi:MAG: queuosine precursor transporter [Synergistaceae bacterium]
MTNELLLVLNLVFVYSSVLFFYKLFGKVGLFIFTVIATITANIEALILINAFGMEQTLGNILFASTFLITDILSEMHGKKDSITAVRLSICTSVVFIILTQFWLFFTPSNNDIVMGSIRNIFSHTPRLMFSSFIVYAISQYFDVWAYHKWWDFTKAKFHDKDKFLWLRNNGSTLISQFINTVLFTIFAFGGIYEIKTLVSIIFSTYLIYIVTSLADTPVLYIAKYMTSKEKSL